MTVEKEPCKSKDMMPSQKGTLHIGAEVKGELVVHLTWAIVAPSLGVGLHELRLKRSEPEFCATQRNGIDE